MADGNHKKAIETERDEELRRGVLTWANNPDEVRRKMALCRHQHGACVNCLRPTGDFSATHKGMCPQCVAWWATGNKELEYEYARRH